MTGPAPARPPAAPASAVPAPLAPVVASARASRAVRHQVARRRSAIDWDSDDIDWTLDNYTLAEQLGAPWKSVAAHRTDAIAEGRAVKRQRGTATPEQSARLGTEHPSSAKDRARRRESRRTIPETCDLCGAFMAAVRAVRFRGAWACPACVRGVDLLAREELENCAREATRRGEGVVW